MSKLEISEKKLQQALLKLNSLIDKTIEKKPDATTSKLQRLTTLNAELEKDNSSLKEQLFSALTTINALKERNKKIDSNIDEAISSLEKMVG